MSQSQKQKQHSNGPSVDEDEPGTYFDNTTEEWLQLEARREELALQQEAVKRLDEQVAKIDCDIGSGSIEISDEGVIHVKTATPGMHEEVKELVHGHSWPKESKIGYDTRSQCVTWSLKTDITRLVDDYHQEITE